MQVHRRAAWLFTGLLLAPACGGGGSSEPDAAPATTDAPRRAATSTSTSSTSTTGAAPTTTTSTPAVDPSVIPEDPAAIDEAYVEAVLKEHDRVIGDALRLQLEGADLKEIVDRYNAIYVPKVADALLTSVLQPSDEILASLKFPPGDQVTDVVRLVRVTSECVQAEVLVDLTPVLANAPTATADTIVIRRAAETPPLNETAWMSEGVIPGVEIGGEGC